MYFDADTFRTMLRVVHDPATFSLRRLVLMDTLAGVLTSVRGLNALGEARDARVHPGIANVDVGEPIYIVAAPRSGTTFLHRLMSLDPRFTTFKLYETIFPTVSAYETINHITRDGGLLARVGARAKEIIDERSFGGWEGLHDTGLDKDEEDEALWALMMATPALLILLPFAKPFEHLRFIDRMPEEKKQQLIASYRSCLQRKLYSAPGKTLLMKNVLLPGRFDIVSKAAPGARFVHIVRHPYEAIASSLSLFTLPWTVLRPEVHGATDESRDFGDLMIDYYRYLYEQELANQGDSDRFIAIKYTDLLADPLARLRDVYGRFGLAWTPELEGTLNAELHSQAKFRSNHAYSLEQFGLTKSYIDERLGDVMDHYGFVRSSESRISDAARPRRTTVRPERARDLA